MELLFSKGLQMSFKSIISVIIPSYNHSAYIEETVISVIDQDYEGMIEIIIVDDCSTDNTLNVIEKYYNLKLDNRKIIIHKKDKNKGINDSIEIGLKYSTGCYIQLLASDDILLKNKLSIQSKYMIEKECDGVYATGYSFNTDVLSKMDLSNFKMAYENGKAYEYVCSKDFDGPLLQSGLFRRELFVSTMEIRRSFKSDDWAFAIEIFKKYNIGFINEYLFKYRQHEDNTFKKYLITFPMRVDVISRLIPIEMQAKAYSNIFYSHAIYLINDKKIKLGLKFISSSFIFNPSFENFKQIIKLFIPKSLKKVIKKYILRKD